MEILRGKQSSLLDAAAFHDLVHGYHKIHVDLGTGDGRYVRDMAQAYPQNFFIGIDASRENLYKVSRSASKNTLFMIANAETLPETLNGLATQITVNFPWGSLIRGLLYPDSRVLHGLEMLASPDAGLYVHLNGGALAEAGMPLEAGAEQVREAFAHHGFNMFRQPTCLTTRDLKVFPSSWAKRLAFGRDPRAVLLQGNYLPVEEPVEQYLMPVR